LLLKLLWHTPEPERLIGAAMRRCYTTHPIETILREVSKEYGEYLAASAFERSEYDVYEHVRVLCLAVGSDREVLYTLLRHRYIEATPLGGAWLFSFNLRTAVEGARLGDEGFTHVVEQVCPIIARMLRGGGCPERPPRQEVKPEQPSTSMRVIVLRCLTPKMLGELLPQHGLPPLPAEEAARHCYLTFEIEGISRVCSHQLVRHRPASYSQESQRFSPAVEEPFIIPETIQRNDQALALSQASLNMARETYARLRALGVKKEDARFVLPQATATKLMVTLTARYLRHMAFFRSSYSPIGEKAQWEIRAVVDAMAREAMGLMPEIDWRPREAL
jgi:thymidylate synthase (FAD)